MTDIVRVTTQSSSYVIDRDEGTLIRYPGPPSLDWDVAALRRDQAHVRLIEIVHLKVGDPAVFLLDGLAAVGQTTRTTTPVVSIE